MVPQRWADCRVFFERLDTPVIVPVGVKGHPITFIVEPTKSGYVHASTPEDIMTVLDLFELEHLEEIGLVVLRQPKRKEEILRPVWGRFVYYADLGRYSGPAIYLEAIKRHAVMKWGKQLDPYEKRELRSLESDGHRIVQTRRGYDVHTTPSAVRNTQLYRTLAHEVGHAVDYLDHSLRPSTAANSDAESEYIDNRYLSKPTLDKEEYAHRYSREFLTKWVAEGRIPFSRKFDQGTLKRMGLSSEWFRF